MVREEAFSYIESFINGSITGTNSSLQEAIDLLANTCASSITKWNLTINGSSTDRFDNDIKAFAYYWGVVHGSKGYSYNNNYIKAMLAVESKVGTYDGSRNGKTDVMQCLDKDNPSVYCMAKIAPGNGVAYDSNEGLSKGMTSSGYKAVRNLFSGNTPTASKYTARLSICFGILWLGYKTAVTGSIDKGITAYNGGGDSNYLTKVKSCANNPAAFLGL